MAPEVITLILAGGQGKRLYPLTKNHCKPAVPYGGRYRLIDIPISNSLNAQFQKIFVLAQYLATELQQHIRQSYAFGPLQTGFIDVLTPQETESGEKEWFAGTADAVRKNLSFLSQTSADYFLILSGDQLYNIDFQEMLQFALKKEADLVIACHPIDERDAKRMGLIKTNAQQKVIDFIEKPQAETQLKPFVYSKDKPTKKYLGSMGIYLFNREALFSLLEKDQRADFGYHLLSTAVSTSKTYSFLYDGYWEDIGTVSSYYKANLLLTSPEKGLNTYDELHPIYAKPTCLPSPKIHCAHISHSIIADGSIVEAEEITQSIIGLRSHIKRGTRIRSSLILGNPLPIDERFWSIGEDCLIETAIIDEQVQIGDRVQLSNREKHTHFDGPYGLFVREGIILITAGSHIPNDFVF